MGASAALRAPRGAARPRPATAPLRVAHVITGLGPGGAEHMLVKLIARMDGQRFAHTVVSLTGGGRLAEELGVLGVPVFAPRGSRGRPSLVSLLRAVRALRGDAAPQLLQGWMPHGNLAAMMLAAAVGAPVPVVWNVRQAVYDLRYESPATARLIRFGAQVSRRATAIVYNSAVAAAQHAELGYAAGVAHVLPNGFDTDVFAPNAAARTAARREWGAAEDDLVIGAVARYHPMKDHATLLRAVRLLAARDPRVLLVAAGSGVTPAQPGLAALVHELGIESRVRLLGDRADVARLYPGFDMACLSSYTEGFPNVVGEAMACGVPCVATDVGASREVIGDTGRLVSPRDPAALAEALDALRTAGPGARRQLGARARARIQSEFGLDAIARRYEALYANLASHVTER